MDIIRPVIISEPTSGVYVVDFGRHFSGGCRLKVKGREGSQIELRYGDLLAPSGEVDQSNMRDPTGEPKRDLYILKGDPVGEAFASQFCFRGFRYVEIRGLENRPSAESIEGVLIHSDLPLTGCVRSDNPLVERIWRNILQSQKSNFIGIPTDNTVREFRGYTGDAPIFWDTASFNMDLSTFTARYMDGLRDDQAPDGAFPVHTPLTPYNSPLARMDGAAPAYGSAGVILPWMAWRRYGDLSTVEQNWDAMNRYLHMIEGANPDFLWINKRSVDHGDFHAIGPTGIDLGPYTPGFAPTTPLDLIATAYWAHSAALLAQMAQALGRTADVKRLHRSLGRIRHAFNKRFVNADGTIGNGSQTSYILALQFELLSEQKKKLAVEQLVNAIRHNGTSLSTGMLGTQFALEVLATNGFVDLAHELLLRTQYPSWGYMVRMGATSIWEFWNGRGSRNQFALGAIGGFLFRCIAGIDADSPGFETIVIHPRPSALIRSGGGYYDSVKGRISTDWSQLRDQFTISLRIPPNSTAQVHLPALAQQSIIEGYTPLHSSTDAKILRRSKRSVLVEVGSGSYKFRVE